MPKNPETILQFPSFKKLGQGLSLGLLVGLTTSSPVFADGPPPPDPSTDQSASFNITQDEIESLRILKDGRRYSCMEDLPDIIGSFGDLGREVVITVDAVEAAESSCDISGVSNQNSRGRLQAHAGTWAPAVARMGKIFNYKSFWQVVQDKTLDMRLYRIIYNEQGMAAWDPCDINIGKKGAVEWVVNCEAFDNVYLGRPNMVVRH